jgi:hypothetical protein
MANITDKIKNVVLGKLDDKKASYITPGLTYINGRPESLKLPSLEAISKLDNSELLQVLNHYNVFGPTDQFKMESMEYVSRMTSYPPGSQAFSEAVAALGDTSSKRGLVGMTRRASENYSTVESIDGNVEQELIYVCLDDNASCKACLDKDGEIHTFIEWQDVGGPGAATCAGGHNCRCSLIRVDNE